MFFSRTIFILLAAIFLLPASFVSAADPTPEELTDLAAPEGVDEADVQHLFQILSGEIAPGDIENQRGDVAPGTLLSPDGEVPTRVRPNPNPDGSFDIGDAVLAARRAVGSDHPGYIVFDGLNESPAIHYGGMSVLTNQNPWSFSGTVSDDQALELCTVEVWLNGEIFEASLNISAGGVFAIDLPLLEGLNEISARATDGYGRIGEFGDVLEVTLDTVAPVLAFDVNLDGAYTNQTPFQVTGTASDIHEIVEILVHGVSATLIPDPGNPEGYIWGADVSFGAEGPAIIQATAEDAAGNVSDPVAITVTYDDTNPTVAFDAYPSPTNLTSLTLTGVMADAYGVESVQVNGQETTLDTGTGSWSIVVSISEGDNTFTAVATDYAGNQGSDGPINIIGDFIPPVLTLLSDDFVNYTDYDWIIGISEPVFLNNIDGVPDGTFYDGVSFTLAGWSLENGANTIELTVSDPAGNTVTQNFTVTVDTEPPIFAITEAFNNTYLFKLEPGTDIESDTLPLGNALAFVTNAPTVGLRGTVEDAVSGVESVRYETYDAMLAGDTFAITGIPLTPRANSVTLTATDGAGNSTSITLTAHQDVEGPEIVLDNFQRGAHVSTTGQFNDANIGNYDGSSGITVTGTATDIYTNISDITVTWAGTPLPVALHRGSSDFEFTIPADRMADSNLNLLSITATDQMANANLNHQSALTGTFALRGPVGQTGETIQNGIGLGLEPNSLSAFTAIIEEQIEAIDGADSFDQHISDPISADIQGLAFCDPATVGRSRYDGHGPVSVMDPPTCRYYCDQDVVVEMSINQDPASPNYGKVQIIMTVPYLHVDLHVSGSIVCLGGSEVYAAAHPATISMVAEFVDSEDGPQLVADTDSIVVGIDEDDFSLAFENGWCALGWFAGSLKGMIVDMIKEEFQGAINDMLSALGDSLAAPIMEGPNTHFSVYIYHIQSAPDGFRIWLDLHGNPCPDPSELTDKPNPDTPEEDDFLPCLDPNEYPPAMDIYNCPGSLVTANPDPSDPNERPWLTMHDSDDNLRSLQAAINDDFVNYYVYHEWAQGTLDMDIDQEMLGDGMSLDTEFLGLVVPELVNEAREDVQTVVPTGTPVLIQLHAMVPITVEGIDNAAPNPDGIRLRAGDLILSFFGDTDGNGDYETPIFDIAVTMYADASLELHPATASGETDYISLDIDPENADIYADLVWSAFIIHEGTLQSRIPDFFATLLPTFLESMNRIDLPGSGLRVSEFNVIDPNNEFINILGDLVAAIAILQPGGTGSGNLPFEGRINGLIASGGNFNAEMNVYVGPNDGETPDDIDISGFSFSVNTGAGYVDWNGSIDLGLLSGGENVIRVVVTDHNNLDSTGTPKTAYTTMVVEYDTSSGEWEVLSGQSENASATLLDSLSNLDSCMGCQSPAENASPFVLGALFALMLAFWRRRKTLSGKAAPYLGSALLLLGLLALSACDSSSASFLEDGDLENTPDGDFEIDGDITPDGDTDGNVDGDEDGDTDGNVDGDADGDTDDDSPVNHFTGPDVDDDPVVILNMVQIGGETDGFNLDEGRSPEGDPDPDNGVAILGSLANKALTDAMNEGSIILLLQFLGLDNLPAAGESGTVNIRGYLGKDMDEDPSNNFDGDQTFAIDPGSFDEDGNLLISFDGVEIYADESGAVHMHGGPAVFTLSIPLSEGAAITLTITETQLESLLQPSTLRQGGIDLTDGLLGGIIPCSILAEPIESLGGMAPLSLLSLYVDIDLNEDGSLDHENSPDNEDGITAGVLVTGVPAFIDFTTANRAPVITLDPVAETVTEPGLTVTGVFDDPDGACIDGTVTVRVNELEAVQAATNQAGEGCTFTAEIRLELGDNAIVAKVVDEKGAEASDRKETVLNDETPPVVTITAPADQTVTDRVLTLSGTATDNVGILGVTITVTDGQTYAVLGENLGANGEFDVEIELPKLGENPITVQAKDLADNLSTEVPYPLTLVDIEAPVITMVSVSDGVITVEPPDDLVIHEPEADIVVHVSDNTTATDQLTVEAELNAQGVRERVPCMYNSVLDTFSVSFTLELGDNPVTFYTKDASENEATETFVVRYLDNEPPVIQVTAPVPTVNEVEQTLRFTVEDNIDAAELLSPMVLLNSTDSADAMEAYYDDQAGDFYLILDLQLGENNVQIDLADLSGNETQWTGVFTLEDIEPPVLTVTTPQAAQSETFDESVTVIGSVTDNIGLASPGLTIDVNGASYEPTIEEDGSFEQIVDLVLGENVITVTAFDNSELTINPQEIRTVTRFDPDAPATIRLDADPVTLLIDVGESTLTATVERLAGGPVPAGTTVTFTADPSDLGTLSAETVATSDETGVVSVTYSAGPNPGSVSVTAAAGSISDAVTLNISEPTLAVLDLCTDGQSSFAGAEMSLNYGGSATVQTPPSTSLEGVGPAAGFYTYNTAAEAPNLYLAGASLVEVSEETVFGQFSWPLGGGVPLMEDFGLNVSEVSDLLGETSPGAGFAICGLDNRLGDLPPIVNLNPISPSDVAEVTVTGTVQDADLSTCTGVLIVNGTGQDIDVTSGSVSVSVTLQPGENLVTLIVTDAGSQTGSDSIRPVYSPQNDLPVVAVTAPEATTADESVLVSGTVSDDGPLSEITLRVNANGGAWVNAAIDEPTGTWTTESTLALNLGANVLNVEATDGLNGVTRIQHSVRRIEPPQPPVITIDEPADGADFDSNPVRLRGGIAQGGNPVEITITVLLDGEEQPFSWDFINRRLSASFNLIDGPHTILVRAEDIAGGYDEVTRNITFTAPDDPPVITITSPNDGANMAATQVLVSGTIVDDRPLYTLQSFQVKGVDVTVDDPDATTSTWSATVPLDEGANVIEAGALDMRGNTASDSITVNNVTPPSIVMNYVAIGTSSEGFNVDQVGLLGDLSNDNALSALGGVANGLLLEKLAADPGNTDPLLMIFQLEGLAELPGPGESTPVVINGYIGEDLDGDPTDNYSGSEVFGIDPASFDSETGLPLIRFEDVEVVNDFGVVRVNTYPDNPAYFNLDIEVEDGADPLSITVDPTYLALTLSDGEHGIELEESLLGGVVPAGNLSMTLELEGQEINPLALLLSDSASDPVPDVDLNEDGVLATGDSSPDNPDGISVGIKLSGVPCGLDLSTP